jgi:hypothetical protein
VGINPRTFKAGAIFEPLAVSKTDAMRMIAMRMIAMPKLVQRWLHYGWVEIVRTGDRGRETVVDFQSLKSAYDRYKKGEEPPLLPSEMAAAKTARHV